MPERATETILSMGLDVGTTTTILIISRLKVKNMASLTTVPRIEIVAKEVVYAGRVHETPFLGEDAIDEERLMGLILSEYGRAGISPEDVSSGAVIVTGQAAMKSNAENVLHKLAVNAGRFVVASAGPHLEAIIAGRGAGADQRSKRLRQAVANIDIGGGTTNVALFASGEPRDALAVNVGGRLIRIDRGTGRVEHVTEYGSLVLDQVGVRLKRGDRPGLDQLRSVAKRLAAVIQEIMSGSFSDLAASLMIGQPRGPRLVPDSVSFSGGVGNMVYEGRPVTTLEEAVRFGDIGPLLAEEIRKTRLWASGRVHQPEETIYATVIGAGAHLTELSGSTIFISSPEALPLRNVPVVRLFDGGVPPGEGEVRDAVSDALRLLDATEGEAVALAVRVPQVGFGEVMRLARGIDMGFRSGTKTPIVIVASGDFGKVLGQTIRAVSGSSRAVISIDQVQVENGDYIDIGEPLYSGSVVPVIVKTLVFGR